MKMFQPRAMLGKLCVVVALVSTSAVMVAGAASATTTVTLYVASNGTATTGCTDSSNPCTTIQDGVTAAESDVGSVKVDVATGTYDENVTIDVPIDDAITLQGVSASSTIADGGDNGSVFTISSGVVSIDGFSIENGSASIGGGVWNSGTATLSDDTLTNDSTPTGDGGTNYSGGAVFNNTNATVTMSNDTLSSDSGQYGGAVWNSGTATLSDDTLTNDSTPTGNGGGIFNDGTATLANDTLSSDSASGDGGGVDNAGTITLTNDTLSGDSAVANGGGVFNSGAATIANSIMDGASCSGNTPGDGGYNVQSDGTCTTGTTDVVNSTTINLAASLAANGSIGPETLAIGTNSSAFEEVPAASCTIATDERGLARPGMAGENCDAGAYEYQPAAPITFQSQSIDFAPLASVSVTTTQVALSATTTSGLVVTFTSTTPGVCTVNAETVSVLATGTCSITASQAGNAFVTAAPNVTESFSVTAAPVTLPGSPVVKAMSPFKGRLRITLTSPASGATSYQYSLDGRAWVKLAGKGPFTLTGLRHVTVSVRLRGVNTAGDGRASNAVRLRVRS